MPSNWAKPRVPLKAEQKTINLPAGRQVVQSERVASPPEADRCGGRKGGFGGISARQAHRAQNQFGFFQIHTVLMNNPFFSIIIPSYNEEKNLPILLNSISQQTINDFETIVIDSESQDNTKKEAEKFSSLIPKFKFIIRKMKNVSAARNYGASLAQGNFLIFFDADVEIEPSFLEGIKKNIEKYNLDSLTVWNRGKQKTKGFYILAVMNFGLSLLQKIKPLANGPCMIMKKKLFDKVHGFDEEIVFGEDFNIMEKIAKGGIRFKVFSKPIIYVSTRRFDQEGIMLSLYKSVKAFIYQIFIGPIKKPIFEYKMGGQEFKNK